jgi:hypothetical protein
MNSHEHGPHECYCPDSGYSVVVEAGVPCNTLRCPGDGMPMRASQTGEYRSTRVGRVAYPVAQDSHSGLKWGVAIVGGLAALGLIASLVTKKPRG